MVKAIDVHVHLPDKEGAAHTGIFKEHAERYFGRKFGVLSADALVGMYRDLDMMA